MAELLSQSQIDELLGLAKNKTDDTKQEAADPNEIDSRRVRKYDFYSQKKISKKRMKMLDGIFESYARNVSSHITSLLRLACTVEVTSMEEQRYYEFNNALGENDIISIINMDFAGSQQESHYLLQVSNQTIMAMIDRLLGGEGDPADLGSGSYTDIELAIYETLVKRLASLTKDSWSNYMDIDFSYFRYETNPRLVQTISYDEIVVIVVLTMTIKDTIGNITICLPSDVLSEVFEKFEKDSQIQSAYKKGADDQSFDNLVYNIKNTDLEITASLGNTYLLMSDLFNMRPGDVINLNKPKDSEVYLKIGGKPWFKGKLGVYNQNKAVKVSESYENNKDIIGEEI